jgi:hypothetical protein
MLACGSGTGGLLLGGLRFLADMAISRGLPEGSSFSWLTFAGAAVGATAGFAIAEGMRVNEVKMDSVGLDVSKMVLTEFVRRAESIPGWPRMVVHDSVFRKGARRPDGLVLEMGICDLAMGPTRGVTLAAVATLFDQGRNVLWQRAAKYNSQDIGHTPPTLPSGFSNAPVDQSYYLLSLTSFYRRELSAGASYVATVMASKPPSAQWPETPWYVISRVISGDAMNDYWHASGVKVRHDKMVELVARMMELKKQQARAPKKQSPSARQLLDQKLAITDGQVADG